MLRFVDKTLTYDSDRCVRCGACLAVCPVEALSVKNIAGDRLQSITIDRDRCISCGKCVKVCPSTISTGDKFGKEYFAEVESADFSFSRNTDDKVAAAASSGGVARTLIIESLRSGAVDGVYALGQDARGVFYTRRNIPAYEDVPTSVYRPVMQCRELREIQKCDTLMLVGTSCQLRALEASLGANRPSKLLKVCIFCKQQKTVKATRFVAKMAGAHFSCSSADKVTYRGHGWPGQMTVNGKSVAYIRPAGLIFGHRLWSVPGCNICGDPFGVYAGADLALMDPWGQHVDSATGCNLVVAFTPAGSDLLRLTPGLKNDFVKFNIALPALGISDIRRKQTLVPYYRGERVGIKIRIIGALDRFQRSAEGRILLALPRLPMIIYRVICRIPPFRNILIR